MLRFGIPTLAMALLAVAGPANAQFVQPTAFGWERGDVDTVYFEWDFFFFSGGGNAPDVGQFPSPLPAGWAEPDVAETTGAAFLTSTGNIYSFAENVLLEFEVTIPSYGLEGPGVATSVVFQVKTQGREIDPETVLLDGAAPLETVELFREPFEGSFGGEVVQGAIVETLYRFELVGSADVHTLMFAGGGSSMSLDKVAIDALVSEAVCAGDLADSSGFGAPDGQVDFGDFFALSFLAGPCGGGVSGCTGDLADSSGFGSPDGRVDFGDFFALSFLAGPC